VGRNFLVQQGSARDGFDLAVTAVQPAATKNLAILCVLASSWWIRPGPYHEDAKNREEFRVRGVAIDVFVVKLRSPAVVSSRALLW